MLIESNLRSVAKAFSWRFWGTFATAGLVYILTGQFTISILVGGFEATAKIILYYLHERIWSRISYGKKEFRPVVVWFTGLSGAGKTTTATEVVTQMKSLGLRVEHLDGDRIRNIFPQTGFSRNERNLHIQRIGHLASCLEKNGVSVVASFISPYEESRRFVRNICQNFVEVYLSTPLEECERRDSKGLYKLARSGKIKNFTGVSEAFEPPQSPDVVIDTTRITVEEAGRKVLESVGPAAIKSRRDKSITINEKFLSYETP
ncbi:MAG: adenylyl-sulfate kinase [Oligoflexia bacterium]|nr:adenylyl-sulfate kinase [Oligoflexia bacterium]